ncbi:anti-sigma factor domain-containing protein [Naasia sp. SYSU D00057]|uniref:anti-sigma factor n=1 Tax=Naasia sp. SYSU D00057 TaxID=2817380 RepID=UPI001B30C344|nr:anti-sigma factor [Naasia sp. SYSU D00057]
MSRRQLHNLSGAYVLNALDREDEVAFEAGLADSEELRAEVIELSDTAVALGLAVAPVEPSPSVRADLLARVAQLPQLPAIAEQPTLDASTVRTPGPRSIRWKWRALLRVPVLVPIAAVLAVLLAVVLGPALLHGHDDAALDDLSAARDARTTSVTMAGASGVALLSSHRLDAAALVWDSLPALEPGTVYELWYIRGGDPTPAGLIEDDAVAGDGQVLTGELRPGVQVALTVEPAGGSPRPTGTPLFVVEPA